MSNDFNELEEKNTNNFALVFGVFVFTVVFAFMAFFGILSVKDKFSKALDSSNKTQATSSVKSSKAVVSNIEAKNVETLGDFKDYMPKMQNKIKSNWNPPKSEKPSKVILNYEIKKDGTLGEIKVSTSSGDNKVDEMAIEALKKSAPFEPLPKGFAGDKVDVQFTFDYNVYQK